MTKAQRDARWLIERSRRRRNAAPAFSPLDLEPLLWLRADLGVTTRDDGGTLYVTAWADQSGNAHDFAQVTEANQPVLSTLGGKAAVDFDGANDFLAGAPFAKSATNATILYVVDADDTADNQVVLGDDALSGTIYHENPAGVGVLGYYDGSHNIGPATVAGIQQMAVLFSAAGGTATWRRNRTTLTPTAAYDGTLWPSGTPTWVVGARAGGVTPFDGRIAEIVVVPRLLPAGELAQWDTYAARYGL